MHLISLAALVQTVVCAPVQPPPDPGVIPEDWANVYFEHGAVEAPAEWLPEIWRVLCDLPRDGHLDIRGQTDTLGSDAANMQLSLDRALRIADLAIRAGVDPRRIQVIACGERALNVASADEVVELRNNMVLLQLRKAPPPSGCEASPYAAVAARR
jgi:hypothetical protein